MMKVRISIPGSSVSVEMNDDKSRKVFSTLARELLIYGSGGGTDTKKHDRITGKAPEPTCEMNAEENPDETSQEEERTETREDDRIDENGSEEVNKKYKGFMYIKCPSCGSIKGFNMKKPSDHYHCDSCGTRSEFKDSLVPLWVNCECGKGFLYMTNMKEPIFDISCLECGAPVTVKWNEKKRVYETIRR